MIYIVNGILIFEKFECYIKDFVTFDQYKFCIKFNSVNGTYATRSIHIQVTGMSTWPSYAAALLHSWADLRTVSQVEGHTSTVA